MGGLADELAFCVARWAYYRGTLCLLLAVVILNALNLALMWSGRGGAQNKVDNRALLPSVILFAIVRSWAVIHRYKGGTQAPRPRVDRAVPAQARPPT